MKKAFLVLSIICFFSNFLYSKEIKLNTAICKVDTLPTSQLITFLGQINVENFYGQPVDSFLTAVDAIPYNMKIYGGSNSQGAIFRASYLWYNYSGGIVLRIYVSNYTHMNRYSSTGNWDVNLFRQENIYKIEVYNDQNICINGSCMN